MIRHYFSRGCALLMLILAACNPASAGEPSPREFLETLYHATDGDNWHHNDGWLDPQVHWCDWYGVECVANEFDGGIPVFERLDLAGNNLNGSLPAELSRFAAEGQLPEHTLDLGHNNIGGTLDDLPVRTFRIILSSNQLSGPLPERKAPPPFRLRHLALDNNRFEDGARDGWWPLTLRSLDLSDNRLDSGINNAFGAITGFSRFGFIDLSANRFSGELLPGPVMGTNLHTVYDSQGGRLNLCWNDFEIIDDELDEWIRQRHVGGPDYRECLGRERQPLDLSVSGSWFDPERSGEGVVLHLLDSGIPLLYWFSFDLDGNQQWLFGTGRWFERHVRLKDLLQTRGHFGHGFILDEDSKPLSRKTGFLTMHRTGNHEMYTTRTYTNWRSCPPLFNPPPHASPCVIYFMADRLDHKQLTLLAGTTCTNQSPFQQYSGAWFDPATPGEGFVVEALPDNRGVVYWFTYAADGSGQQAWMMGDGDFVTVDDEDPSTWTPVARIVIDTLHQPIGGVYGSQFDPASIDRINWGTLKIEFYNDEAGHAFWQSNLAEYGSGDSHIQRLARPMLAECE